MNRRTAIVLIVLAFLLSIGWEDYMSKEMYIASHTVNCEK